ncbi:hypothetical protein OIO90_005596 [Microbotryomycetes sp. JL221]|nr:hypothetical protein OIO90_005596 [Microbotryomycetes sp. JL221]
MGLRLAWLQTIHTGRKPYRCPEKGCQKSFCRKTTLLKHLKNNHPSSPGFSHAESWRAAQAELDETKSVEDEEDDEIEDDGDEEFDRGDTDYRPLTESSVRSTSSTMNRQRAAHREAPVIVRAPARHTPVTVKMEHGSPDQNKVYISPPSAQSCLQKELSNYRFGTGEKTPARNDPSSNLSSRFAPPAIQGAFSYPMTPASSTQSSTTTSKLDFSPAPSRVYKFPLPPAPQTRHSEPQSVAMQHSTSNPLPHGTEQYMIYRGTNASTFERHDSHVMYHSIHPGHELAPGGSNRLEPAWVPHSLNNEYRSHSHHSNDDYVQNLRMQTYDHSAHGLASPPTCFDNNVHGVSFQRRRASSTPALLDSKIMSHQAGPMYHTQSYDRWQETVETGLGLDTTS